MEKEEFWQNELQIEQESEWQLWQKLTELQGRVRNSEAKLSESLARIQVSLASLCSYLWVMFYSILFKWHENIPLQSLYGYSAKVPKLFIRLD